jgi:hypothetical protein
MEEREQDRRSSSKGGAADTYLVGLVQLLQTSLVPAGLAGHTIPLNTQHAHVPGGARKKEQVEIEAADSATALK